jgi:hypothetical protein
VTRDVWVIAFKCNTCSAVSPVMYWVDGVPHPESWQPIEWDYVAAFDAHYCPACVADRKRWSTDASTVDGGER